MEKMTLPPGFQDMRSFGLAGCACPLKVYVLLRVPHL